VRHVDVRRREAGDFVAEVLVAAESHTFDSREEAEAFARNLIQTRADRG
jgi:hypothetical protein